MSFKELMLQAKSGDNQAVETLLKLYDPLLMKESIVGGVFDEDLHQELCITLINCIRNFRI
jgi:hypothetical protein